VTGDGYRSVGCTTVWVSFGADRLGSVGVGGGGRLDSGDFIVPPDATSGHQTVVTSCHTNGSPVLAHAVFDVHSSWLHPGAIPATLHGPNQIPLGFGKLVWSIGAAALLLVILAFPAELFERTLEEHYDEVRAWFAFVPTIRVPETRRSRALAFGGFITLAAVAGAVADPAFAVDGTGLALLVGAALGLVVVTAGFSLPVALVLHYSYRERTRLHVLPLGLAIALGCAAISYAFHLEPAYLYGIVAGFVFTRALRVDEHGRLASLCVALVLAVSLVAWVAWVPVHHAMEEDPSNFLLVVAGTALATIFIAGITSSVVTLIPIRTLQGEKVIRWNRAAWIALEGFAMVVLIEVLTRDGSGFVAHDRARAALVIFLPLIAFTLVSVAFWAYFRLRPEREEESPGDLALDEA
jgi:hypothetical protein